MIEIVQKQHEFIVGKTNPAIFLYDHLMISAIALIGTVFIVFNHVRN